MFSVWGWCFLRKALEELSNSSLCPILEQLLPTYVAPDVNISSQQTGGKKLTNKRNWEYQLISSFLSTFSCDCIVQS